jgi:hypothetical protein
MDMSAMMATSENSSLSQNPAVRTTELVKQGQDDLKITFDQHLRSFQLLLPRTYSYVDLF